MFASMILPLCDNFRVIEKLKKMKKRAGGGGGGVEIFFFCFRYLGPGAKADGSSVRLWDKMGANNLCICFWVVADAGPRLLSTSIRS